MSFASSLIVWEKAQKEFAKILLDKEKIISLEFAQGKFSDWDIKICTTEWEKTYEIKSDTMAQDTWNYVIESRFKWKPSWIFNSKSDYIVYCVKWERWIQERWELILRLMNAEKRETKWGDWWQSTLWILKCETLPILFDKVEACSVKNEKQN